MLFENNGTLQKWHMTHFPPEIDKYDTHNKWCLTKMAQLMKICQQVISQGLSRVVFKRELLNLLYDSHLTPSFFVECYLISVLFL